MNSFNNGTPGQSAIETSAFNLTAFQIGTGFNYLLKYLIVYETIIRSDSKFMEQVLGNIVKTNND